MKVHFALLLCIISFSIIKAQTTELDHAQLSKSKVLSITVMGASFDINGAASRIRTKKEYRKYSTSGYPISEIVYNEKGAIVSNTTNLFSKTNLKLKSMTKDGTNTTIKRSAYSFNKKGEKIKCEGTDKGKLFKIIYKYDKKGNQIERKKTFEDGSIGFHTIINYDSIGNISEEHFIGKQTIRITYQYDNHNWILAKNTFVNDLLSYSFVYEYDDKGNKTKETKYDSKNVILELFDYVYHDNGKINMIYKYNRTYHLQMMWKYFYNEKWNIDKIKIFEGEDKTAIYQTEYLYKYY